MAHVKKELLECLIRQCIREIIEQISEGEAGEHEYCNKCGVRVKIVRHGPYAVCSKCKSILGDWMEENHSMLNEAMDAYIMLAKPLDMSLLTYFRNQLQGCEVTYDSNTQELHVRSTDSKVFNDGNNIIQQTLKSKGYPFSVHTSLEEDDTIGTTPPSDGLVNGRNIQKGRELGLVTRENTGDPMFNIPKSRDEVINKIKSQGKEKEFINIYGNTPQNYFAMYANKEPDIWTWVMSDLGLQENTLGAAAPPADGLGTAEQPPLPKGPTFTENKLEKELKNLREGKPVSPEIIKLKMAIKEIVKEVFSE